MTETTQEERTQVQEGWLVSPNVIERMANDADRLARLEDGIRALADKWKGDVERWPRDYSREWQEEVSNAAKELRALLDGE